MAQVLLNQKNNQGRLKRGFYEIAKKLLTSEIQEDSLSLSKLRKRSESQENNVVSSLSDVIPASPVPSSPECDSPDNESDCDDPTPPQPSRSIKIKIKGFSCTICNHVATSAERLKEHQNRHTGAKPYECEICKKQFAWRFSYRSHMDSHKDDNSNKCQTCGKKYFNKSTMKNHMLRVHGNPKKDFQCDKCDKKFITKSELERHSQNHSSEKPFVCEYCGKQYSFKTALTVHYRTHSGEKPYKCGFCDKAFVHLSSVIGHRRRHTGEKPFQCKDCGKFFRVKQALTAHLAVHSKNKPYTCERCGKGFKSRSGYKVHLDYHLNIKRHKCKYCDKPFRAWCNMHKHMKRHLAQKDMKMDEQAFLAQHEMAQATIVNDCAQNMMPAATITYSQLEPAPNYTESHAPDDIMQSHLDITDNHVMYDCNMQNMDKCGDKCSMLQDSYPPQCLYSQQAPEIYSQQVSMMNMYTSDGRNDYMNSPAFNCLNGQNYEGFQYELPNSDGIISKCKLCRSIFHSSVLLRNHLLEFHRIDEENVDGFLS